MNTFRSSFTLTHLIAALVLMMSVTQPLLALPRNTDEAPPASATTEALGQFQEISGDIADDFVRKALESDDYWHFRDMSSDSFVDSFSLRPDKAYTQAGPGMIGVMIPIDGGAGHSGLQIWFDELTQEIKTTAAMIFREVDSDRFEATFFVDGELRVEAASDRDGNILDGRLYVDGKAMDITELLPNAKSWSCMNSCLAGLGVANWLLALIAAVCAAACIGTAGAGCVVCIAALGFGLGSELGYCAGQCF